MVRPEVTVDQGTLRGSVGTDLRGDSFFKFQGIPYAKPPLGELRFKVKVIPRFQMLLDNFQAPVAPDPWTGTLDATKEGEVCYHRDPFKPGGPSGSENCLFLNVYTKKVRTLIFGFYTQNGSSFQVLATTNRAQCSSGYTEGVSFSGQETKIYTDLIF